MIFEVDGKKIFVDDDKLNAYLKKKMEVGLDKKIKIPNGPTIDLTRTSLLSVAIRQVFNFLIPILTWMGTQLKIELPPKRRHDDVIKYTIGVYFQILGKITNDTVVTVETRPYVDELYTVDTVQLTKENNDIPLFSQMFMEH